MYSQRMFKYMVGVALLLSACKTDGGSASPEPAPAPEGAPQSPVEEESEAEEAAAPEASESPASGVKVAEKDVMAVLEAQANGKTFAELVASSDLAKQLRSMDGAGYTLLVPTDEAFAKLPKGTLERWKKNKDELERVLKYHIVPGTHDVGKLGNFRTAPTALGRDVEVKVEDSDVRVGGAKLLENDIKASNGYVHMIDKVLVPKK